jgi:hypothetical protein
MAKTNIQVAGDDTKYQSLIKGTDQGKRERGAGGKRGAKNVDIKYKTERAGEAIVGTKRKRSEKGKKDLESSEEDQEGDEYDSNGDEGEEDEEDDDEDEEDEEEESLYEEKKR